MTTPSRPIRVQLSIEELDIIADALCYYRANAERGGPDNYPLVDVKVVEWWINHYVDRHRPEYQ